MFTLVVDMSPTHDLFLPAAKIFWSIIYLHVHHKLRNNTEMKHSSCKHQKKSENCICILKLGKADMSLQLTQK